MDETWLVIGAGASGLVAAKNLGDHGLDVDIIEREPALGGNWNFDAETSRIYESTRMISSKPFTEFPDFPMPDQAPDYLHHREVLDYLDRYARHFGLVDRIELRTEVVWCEPRRTSGFDVTVRTADGAEEVRPYAGVVVANGHNWYPKMPDYPGQDTFTGEIIHSADFKTAEGGAVCWIRLPTSGVEGTCIDARGICGTAVRRSVP
jgi:cation diffusion facilitator CzcD-associated flavoprotein CzcO